MMMQNEIVEEVTIEELKKAFSSKENYKEWMLRRFGKYGITPDMFEEDEDDDEDLEDIDDEEEEEDDEKNQ